MAPQVQSTEARELSLVGKVEMKIALADTDPKLEQLLGTYLAPLLMKLGSESWPVRNKVIAVCQHINTRIQSQGIKLPVSALLQQYKDTSTSLIRHFDILYIQQSIDKLGISERLELLPLLLGGISSDATKNAQHGAQLFHLALQLLHHFKLPPRGTKEDEELRAQLKIADEDAKFLSTYFGKLVLFTPTRSTSGVPGGVRTPGLTAEDHRFLSVNGNAEAWDPTAKEGINLVETKVVVMKFLSSGIFTNTERFFPALFATADTNSRIAALGEDIIKHSQSETNLDDQQIVEHLFDLYFGGTPPSGAYPVRIPLRIKILGLLAKSTKSLEYTKQITRLVEAGFISNEGEDGTAARAGLEAKKFQDAIFSYITFAARNGKQKHLTAIAPELLNHLKAFVEDQGWPLNTSGDTRLRGLAYVAIGLLGKTVPEVVANDPQSSLLKWLFQSLKEDDSGSEVLFSIQEALSSLMASYPRGFADKNAELSFKKLLLRYMASEGRVGSENARPGPRRNVQYVATRFANRCLPYEDVIARWVDILAISTEGTDFRELVEEGKRGLDPYWHVRLEGSLRSATEVAPEVSNVPNPDFAGLVEFLFRGSIDEEGMVVGAENWLQGLVTNSNPVEAIRIFRRKFPATLWPAVHFSRLVMIRTALETSGLKPDISDDWERKLDALVSTDQGCRDAVMKYIKTNTQLGGRVSQSVATLLRGAFDLVITESATSGIGAAESFIELYSLTPGDVSHSTQLTSDFPSLEEAVFSNDIPTRNFGAHAFGLIASHPGCDGNVVEQCLQRFLQKAEPWKNAIGAELNKASGSILALAYYFSRLSWREPRLATAEALFQRYSQTLFSMLESSRDNVVLNAVSISVGQLGLFSAISLDDINMHVTFSTVVDKIGEIARKGSTKAIIALGYISIITDEEDMETEDAPLRLVEKKLRDLSDLRDAEVHFSVGEALSVLAGGWGSSALISQFDIQAVSSDDKGMPSPHNPTRSSTITRIMKELIVDSRASKPSLRKAATIWLLCMIQYCGHLKPIQEHLRQCQVAFKRCLSDRDDVIQEAASRGLGLVYEKGGQDLKDDLVADLIGMFSDNKAQLAGNVSEDTQLFEPGALPTGDGSVTTYKDILSLASEVGDSSLVYRFMSLASNNSIWSTRAAFGRFGLGNVFSDSSTDGYLSKNPKLFPKLFRYRFDPNTNVQRSMKDIWDALVKDSSATINTHFDAIMDDLLKNILTKEWRTREACCAAISDLLQGRDFAIYEDYLSQIWSMCFKVLDDIKESVRNAAGSLARVLTGILVRSLEAGGASSKRAQAMLEQVLPFLLSSSGLESSAKDVQGLSLKTLMDIIKKSDGPTLRPFIPELVEKFIALLSSLEPEFVNYLRLNASKYKVTEQKIDDARLSSVRGSPLMEAIERCLDLLDEASMEKTMFSLQNAIRSSLDLPSKVGASKILVSLSTRHNFLFRPYADQYLQFIERFIRDRNDTVSASFAMAAGYVARVASDKSIARAIDFGKTMYFDSEEDRHRLLSGDLVSAILKHAPDRANKFTTDILPFVFFGKQDSNEQVKNLFKEIWEENAGGSRAVVLYLSEIVSLSAQFLDSPRWVLKHTSSRTIAEASNALASQPDDITTANAGKVWPALDQAVGGKTWDGKEVVLDAFARFVEKSSNFWRGKDDVGTQITKIILREARRNNKVYQQAALPSLGKVAVARTDIDMSADVFNIIDSLVEEYTAADEDAMDVDGAKNMSSSQIRENMLIGCIKCALACINPQKSQELPRVLLHALELMLKATKSQSRNVRLASFESVKFNFERFEKEKRSFAASDLRPVKSQLSDLLLSPQISDLPEAMRSERAKAVVNVANLSGELIDKAALDRAVGEEKSLMLKKELEKAV
ncbi:ARM repeat-containing protein [Pseudovirgaria hyperparasitica]|uniref:ARM repeat-containing protein n=1 Tax=Pseudovirgaria hyperparasitica TaxID=470096 RepID=A0A6A6W8S1_9PEZI|nr:ARM repeat-containing protein [Pseudovirgaria hyperparasitica]KAF2759252.1 ARM repeat-containing protein [Pseudovirgaria hyperparasitica]